MKTFAERLLYALHASGLSQSELARRIGVKPQNIQYLADRNKKAKGSAYTQSIARETAVSGIWLERGEGAPHDLFIAEPAAGYHAGFSLTDDERTLIVAFRRLPADERRAYGERIRRLARAFEAALPDDKDPSN